ncbi:hypothetical protein J7413_00855 [Shimia sp. R10_1]|uniref:hypothetical protein n=1 Tax=Shimia sp. R10_1 TaxID=2821095 RepID=UPI001ADB7489|nr:hypothetical protein [Shimia sp. R10_1]MBO9472077.1 hypothetical protein [Shimia sp. R10_1]
MLLLAAALTGLYLFEIKPTMEPVVRVSPTAPVFTIGERSSYTPALEAGKTVVKFGPLVFGLYPGGLAFASQQHAQNHMRANGWDLKKWAVYELSGDYAQDTKDGFLTNSLLVVKAH